MRGHGRDIAIVDLLDLVHTSCEVVQQPPASQNAPPAEPSPVTLKNRKPGTPGWAAFDLAPRKGDRGLYDPERHPGRHAPSSTSPPRRKPRTESSSTQPGTHGRIGARRVACLPSCDGAAQGVERPIPIASPEGLVHAGWPVSQSLPVTQDWVSGYYFAHFQLASGRSPRASRQRAGSSFARLQEAPSAAARPGLSDDLAGVQRAGAPAVCTSSTVRTGRRAAKVAFDRPYQQPLEQRPEALEIPLARFLERNGYDVAYQVDVDTARDPGSLVGRKAVAVAGHSEYWSKSIRDDFEDARDAGIDLAFFGSQRGLRQIRYEEDFRTIVGYKNPNWDPETDPALETTLSARSCLHATSAHSWGSSTPVNAPVDDGRRLHCHRSRSAGSLAPASRIHCRRRRPRRSQPRGRHDPRQPVAGELMRKQAHRPLPPRAGTAEEVTRTLFGSRRAREPRSSPRVLTSSVWGLEDIPEVVRMRHGIADPHLQAFTRAMLDDMLGS